MTFYENDLKIPFLRMEDDTEPKAKAKSMKKYNILLATTICALVGVACFTKTST